MQARAMSADPSFDSREFRQALGRFPTGVAVLATLDEQGQPVGLTVSSFNSVSLAPPLILWSLSLGSGSLAAFSACQGYVVNVLSAGQLDLALRFSSSRREGRYVGLEWTPSASGAPRLAGCAAWFDCRHHLQTDAGDHRLFIGEVTACHHEPLPPLIYHAGRFDLTPSL